MFNKERCLNTTDETDVELQVDRTCHVVIIEGYDEEDDEMNLITMENEVLTCEVEMAAQALGDFANLTFPIRASVTVEDGNRIEKISMPHNDIVLW